MVSCVFLNDLERNQHDEREKTEKKWKNDKWSSSSYFSLSPKVSASFTFFSCYDSDVTIGIWLSRRNRQTTSKRVIEFIEFQKIQSIFRSTFFLKRCRIVGLIIFLFFFKLSKKRERRSRTYRWRKIILSTPFFLDIFSWLVGFRIISKCKETRKISQLFDDKIECQTTFESVVLFWQQENVLVVVAFRTTPRSCW